MLQNPLSLESLLTNIENALIFTIGNTISVFRYFFPLFVTVTEETLPWLSIVITALAPIPVPSILIYGVVRYPNPGSIISIVSISPLITLTKNF